MRNKLLRAALLSLGVLMVPALALQAAQPDTITTKADENTVSIVVQNRNFLDMRIYVVRNGTPFRVGTVTSFTEQEFDLPRALTGTTDDIQLVARAIGSRTGYVSHPVIFSKGDTVVFQIENAIGLSSAWVTAGR
jgi:hypothetical protein